MVRDKELKLEDGESLDRTRWSGGRGPKERKVNIETLTTLSAKDYILRR